MWEIMNGMTNGVRNRMFAPKRNNGVGMMTAVLIGASVGIAAWETMRRIQPMSKMGNSSSDSAAQLAQDVMERLD